MNVRCYRCGWNITLSREAIEAAAVSSAGQKAHVLHCPRCRQAIRIPMDQITRALPPGWTPPAPASEPEAAPEPPAAQAVAPAAPPEAAPEPKHSERRHRRSGKGHSGDSAAGTAATHDTHPK